MPNDAQQIAVPPAARALSTLPHVDYADAFLVDAGPAGDQLPEQCARAVLEGSPLTTRHRLQSGWTAIGLKLRRDRAGGTILGWEIRRSTRDFVLLGADSRIGMPAELLFKREGDALGFATFVQHGNPAARAVWAGIEPIHGPTVRRLLADAARRWRERPAA